ncbi:alkaline phosphatase family protein [Streptomyces sp. NPDC001851]|uniref:alkaline phosphatase family protein n=1 Tax=Streptomyces sp. NPDC001851 TaxID=3154529 RepID=UPI00332115DF
MFRRSVRSTRPVTAAAAALAAAGAFTATTIEPASAHLPGRPAARHVLLLSVDGLHQSDLAWYIARHPHAALARLVGGGAEYTHARTTVPSDSFPGMVGQLTGGNPGTTGVYYDDGYDAALLPAGTTTCAGTKRGAEVDLTEDLDKNKDSIDAGQGLPRLPGSILKMTPDAASLIDPAKLPVDPKSCAPVFPHAYLRVNTVFNVARGAGLRTAWSDKHVAYDILNGPSGNGIQDLFAPEINSTAIGYPAGEDWTKDNAATEQYDGYKVQAVLHEIDGYDHSGTHRVGTPAVFGMNFQSVSTAQKLPASDGLAGGYKAKGVPGPLLEKNLAFVDKEVGAFVTELRKRHLDGSTTVVLSAKHGQSPTDPEALTRIDDGPLLDGLNAAWKKAHPGSGDLVAHAVDDDAMLIWLTDRSRAATDFAKAYLLARSGNGTGIDGNTKPFTASGLRSLYAGAGAARYFHVKPGDPRVPDLFGITRYGVVYTGGKGKIAEHGGAHADDLDVPIVVSGALTPHGVRVAAPVETTQIAPTILRLLGLDPRALDAVRAEHTPALPVR